MELEGKKIALLAEDMYEDLELHYPRLRLQEAGAQVTLVGPERRTYTSKHGYPAHVTLPIADASVASFDAVVIPGGYAPDKMRQSPALIDFVRQMDAQKKVVAFICHAGWVPASAGILKGRQVTSWPTLRVDLRNAGAEWVDKEVVRDGHLISSRNPADLPAFCRTIIAALAGEGAKSGRA